MTHDELLEEINKDIDQKPLVKDYYPLKALFALRAVVELHKPKDFAIDTDFPWVGCKECERLYPCPTIQAIEEQIK